MIIPLQHNKKLYAEKRRLIGRHGNWVTNDVFMIKTSVKKCYRRLKPAIPQREESEFNVVLERFFPEKVYMPLIVHEEGVTFEEVPGLVCVRIGLGEWSTLIDKVYFDYFDSLGVTFVTNGRWNKNDAVGLLLKGELVGLVMPVRE